MNEARIQARTITPERYMKATLAAKGCGKCGSKTVMWQQSATTNKWYLTEAFSDPDVPGVYFTSKSEFHSYYCGNPELHEMFQDDYNEAAELEEDDG